MLSIPSEQFFIDFKKTPGAFSCCEAIALHNICKEVITGTFIEAGSNAGKSSMSAASGLPKGEFYLIDPIFDLTNLEAWKHSQQQHPDNLAWGYAAASGFKDEVIKRVSKASEGRITPILLGDFSENALSKFETFSYVFLDSDSHSHERVFGEIRIIENRMISGGIIAFHDVNNQYIAPKEALQYLINTGNYEAIEINWKEIFDYVRANNLEEGNDSWHERGSEEFPKFVGAVRRK